MAWMGAAALIMLIIFAWIILRDLTSNQNYRKQLEFLNKENEQLLRSKTMLMATVTHDLQTPLGSIIGFSDLIDSSDITGKQKQYVHNIKESADYILKLVNDLLDFSRLENNKLAIEEVSFNVKTLIENTCRSLEPAATNKGIELSWDIEEELDNNFISDPYRIKQVLTNLISNSIKFTPEGSVEVTAGVKGDNIIISVLDTGIGIEKEKQAEVFKEFTQAHSGIEKRFGGTGLGLTISKRMLELLGGTISLESQLGQGSIFTLTIPAIPCKNSNSIETYPSVISCDDFTSLKDLRILVIDDDITQLSLMKELLTGYGSNVTTEANSTAAVSLIAKEGFDLILTDIQMPGLDGFDVVNSIRNNTKPVITGVPVIALSGRKDLYSEDYKEAGFTAHHPKPIDLQVLIPLIAKIFGEEIEIKTPEKREKIEKKLFNLKSLSQFTHNDPVSLKMIVDTFTMSADENCIALQEAVIDKDKQKITMISHKMIPMLRQMEVYSIVKLLDPLEDGFSTGLE
jgi:CheY-like chemotaxis protein